jgi:Flp pilus assembly pilin Flp
LFDDSIGLSEKNLVKGQGLVEFALLIVLVVLVIIGSTELLAPIIRISFFRIANPLNNDIGEQTSIPIPTPTATPIPTWATCAAENGFCSFSGDALVRCGGVTTLGFPEHSRMEFFALILFSVIRSMEQLNPAKFIDRVLISIFLIISD